MQLGEGSCHGGDRLVPKPAVVHQNVGEQIPSERLRQARSSRQSGEVLQRRCGAGSAQTALRRLRGARQFAAQRRISHARLIARGAVAVKDSKQATPGNVADALHHNKVVLVCVRSIGLPDVSLA